ncbi:SDR family oxidoreductase [Tropicimonas isoalkanivorans]|uniref:NAD(P)-dependent dehydrogenase, short-chain alcohol dehydrogenase family n=1 Tax=Tropicimonas isoalkanivorans TaxID=441112 RepID=A0A1I1JPG9_9RHOB|nr:SDR family oxidoreductase [Tropicimonas isoalkanivorans]SFC50454.1 NAD(P)-dependent dehydrogenase, short-chain alcohol dehydrogenase family [Tropicimonas isoalkanivorans]
MNPDRKRVALVTNASGFAGPGAVTGLLAGGFRVYAQDLSFSDAEAWDAFAQGRAALEAVTSDDPTEVIGHVAARESLLDAIVSNDHYPAPSALPDCADLTEFDANYRALARAPFALIQQALPILTRQERANIVMVTSNRTRLPLSGGAFPDAARAAANALVKSLAVDLASHGIAVNAVAPNFLYSEAYYPKAVFEQTEAGRAHVRNSVPAGRLAAPEEIGEVILFLASLRTRFLTGAVLDFSGGWPFGQPRPDIG